MIIMIKELNHMQKWWWLCWRSLIMCKNDDDYDEGAWSHARDDDDYDSLA